MTSDRFRLPLKLLCGLLMLAPYCLFTAGEDLVNGTKECRYLWWLKDTVWKYRQYRNLWRCKNLPHGVESTAASDLLGIVVIGESATRRHMSACGYARKTTPWLDETLSAASQVREGAFAFTNVFTSSLYTADAVRLLLSDSTLECPDIHYTLAGACKAAGYRIVAATAQGHWGRWKNFENYEMLLMGPSDSRLCLSDMGGRHDGDLLPALQEAMLGFPKDRPVVAFVHLEGSHSPFYDKYPGPFGEDRFDEWGVERPGKVDFYDASMAYTDANLRQMAEWLRAQGRPAFLLYTSDHGECPKAASMRRPDEPGCWEIPFVAWFSKEYLASFPTMAERMKRKVGERIQQDQLLGGMAEIAGLKVPDAVSFLDADFSPRKDLIMQREGRIIRAEEVVRDR